MLDGVSAHAATQAVQQGSIQVAVKALDAAKQEGQAAVGLIDTAGRAGSGARAASSAPAPDGTGRIVNTVA